MARRAEAAQDQQELFDDENNLSHESDTNDSDAESDAEATIRILHVPGPTADIPELRKALATVQLAFTELCTNHRRLRKEYKTVSGLVSARQLNAALKQGDRNAELDKLIIKEAKKFAMFYQFYLPENLFPTAPSPDVDPRSPSRWTSAETKLEGTVAELYAVMPRSLHKYMETYPRFGSLFRNTHRQERSNILKSIKEVAGVLFTPYKLDASLVSGQHASKGTDPSFLSLLKRDGINDYVCLAPILFENPDSMDADGFLKNPILIKIVRVMIYGKSSLSQLKRGRPKARGERSGIRSITEGLIAAAAIMARFLLTHDPELTDTGAVTQIPYRADYDFYLERLFKRSRWANDVIDLFNREIFGQGTNSTSAGSSALSGGAAVNPARSWEDELLEQMDDPNQVSHSQNQNLPSVRTSASEAAPVPVARLMHAEVPAAVLLPASALPAATSLGPVTIGDTVPVPSLSGAESISGTFTTNIANPLPSSCRAATPPFPPVDTMNSQLSTSIHDMRASSVAISTTSNIQVDLEKMSISNTRSLSTGSAATARQVSSRKVAPPSVVPAMIPDSAAAAPGNLPDKPVQPAIGRTTRARTKGKAANI